MTYTPIPKGTPDWDVPLNAALAQLDADITTTGADALQAASNLSDLTSASTARTNLGLSVGVTVGATQFNVKDYGAVGDNVTNDRTAVMAAITAASAAGGGIVFFPTGTYAISPVSGVCLTVPSNVTLVGEGRRASQIRKNGASSVLIDMSGPSEDATGATHVRYSGIRDLTLNGNSQTGTILRVYYTDNCDFTRVFFTSGSESLVDAVEFWDSRFYNCQFESSGGTNSATLPAVWLRNASSATPATFGYSTDNTNQIVFNACRWENFHNGALRIEDGSVVGNNPNTIYIKDCKMETSQMQGGEHLFTDDSCVAIWVDGLYCFAGGFTGGFSTAQNIITWSGSKSTLENVLISNGGTATIASGVLAFSPGGQRAVLRNITSTYGTAPTGNHIFFVSSTGAWVVENCFSATGSQFGGTLPTAFEGGQPIKQVANIPADSDFVRTPPNGSFAANTLNTDLYYRVGGVWRSIARGGSNPGDQGFIAWNYDSEVAVSTNILTSGTVYVHKVWLPAGLTINNLGFTITTAGSGLTASQNFIGLYTAAGSRVAVSADQSGNWTSTGFKSTAMVAGYLVPTSGYYFIGILAVGTTPPTVASSNGLQTTFNANVTGATLRHAVAATSQTSLPTSITMSGNTSTGVSMWSTAA